MNNLATKNIVLIVVAAAIVGGAFYLTEYRNKDNVKPLYNTNNSISASSSIIVDTTANKVGDDGLTDWERVLLGVQGVDATGKPLKGAFGSTGSRTSTGTGSTTIEKLTTTDRIGRAFFSRYMALKQQGIETDKDSQADLVNDVLAGGIITSGPYIYKDSEYKVGTDTSLDAMKKYGEAIGMIFKTYSVRSRNEAVIVQDSLKKEDPKILAELDPILASYKNITNNIVRTVVPPTLFEQHKKLAQGMSGAVFIVESFKKVNIDPIVGLQAVGKYQENLESIINAIQDIRTQFFILGIKYGPTEAGAMFNKID